VYHRESRIERMDQFDGEGVIHDELSVGLLTRHWLLDGEIGRRGYVFGFEDFGLLVEGGRRDVC